MSQVLSKFFDHQSCSPSNIGQHLVQYWTEMCKFVYPVSLITGCSLIGSPIWFGHFLSGIYLC